MIAGIPRPRIILFVAVFLLALLTRASWGTYRLQRGGDGAEALEFPDEQQYWRMASSLREGEGLRDEFGFRASRMPLYPACLALAGDGPRGVKVAIIGQWVVGAVAAVLTAGLAASVFSLPAGWIAGLMVAFDPFLIFFSSLLLTETAATTVLVGMWWACWPVISSGPYSLGLRRTVLLALLASLSVYLRESSLGLVVLLLLLLAWRPRRNRGEWAMPAVAGLLIAAALIPWVVRNRLATGDWIPLTTRGGVSLYDGFRPGADGGSHLAGIQDAPEVLALGELAWNRHFLEASLNAIREDPGRVVRLAWLKARRTWSPVPNVGTYRSFGVNAISAAWTAPLYLLAVAGIVILSRIRRGDGARIALFLLLPALYFTLLHSLFVGSIRYRIPALPMLMVLASGPLCWVVARWRATCRGSDGLRRSDEP